MANLSLQGIRMKIKHCVKCDWNKPVNEFGKDRNRKDGLNVYCGLCVRENSAIFRSNNPEKSRESSAKYRHKNPEKRKESVRRYCDDNKGRLNKIAAQYRKDHPDKRRKTIAKYNANHRYSVRARNAEWAARNPGKRTAKASKYRAKKLQAMPSWADNQYIEDLYSNCREAEHMFGAIGLDVKFNVDHIIPLQSDLVCGLHTEDNLQILSALENSIKGNHFIPGPL